MRSLGSVGVAVVFALGISASAGLPACSSGRLGKTCTSDAQCGSLVCAAPISPAGLAPLPGTCEYRAGKGGLCYRDATCDPGFVCAFPDRDAPYAEGDCEPASDVD